MRQLCVLGVVALFLASAVWAQLDPGRRVFVEGEVSQEGGMLPDELTVEVYDLQDHMRVDQAMVRRDGRFQFRNLQTGNYWIRIVNMHGDALLEDFAFIHENGVPLSFRIPAREAIRASEGAVSVNRMIHPIPHKAEKEFRQLQKAFAAGQVQQSLEHLEKAIQMCPEYTEAHNNLGARYLMLGQPDKAVKEFRATIALDPAFAKGHVNLSLALMINGGYPEAEAAARRALQLEPESVPAHYALGQVLGLQKKSAPETLGNLRKAVEAYPKARLIIAQVLLRQGAIEEAVLELRAYLASGHPEKRQEVQSWLASLER